MKKFKKGFKDYVCDVYNIDDNLFNKIYYQLRPDVQEILVDCFDNSVTFKDEAKKFNLSSGHKISNIINRALYLFKIYSECPNPSELNTYIIITGIGPLSPIEKLQISKSTVRVLHKNNIFSVRDIIDFINNGNKLRDIIGISYSTDLFIFERIEAFIDIDVVVKYRYKYKGTSCTFSLLKE